MVLAARSSALITYTTCKALFLREAVNRLSSGRSAWLWILLEPVAHTVILVFIFSIVRMRSVGGIDVIIWLMMGLLAFFMFRRTLMQTMNAVDANQALFTYRQVKPIDTALVRACLEGLLMILVVIIVLSGAGLIGRAVIPVDPLAVFEALFGLWLLGLGFGLIVSVLKELIPDLGKFVGLMMMPMYFLSGVIYPIATLAQPYRGWMMLNPIAHGLEAARLGFASYYHTAPELSLVYMYGWALAGIFFGLALHVRYANRMVMQ